MNKKHLIDQQLLVAVIQYLATQPYGEVARLISALENCPPAPAPEPPPAPPEGT